MKNNNILMKRAVSSNKLVVRSMDNQRYGTSDYTGWVDKIISGLGARFVLDVCCGTGNQVLLYAQQKSTKFIAGVDLSSESLEKAQGRLEETEYQGRADFYCSAMEKMFLDTPLKNEKFDLISVFYGLYYSKDFQATLHDMKDHLNDNGKLLIVGPYGDNNKLLFDLLGKHFSLPKLVVYSATTFMTEGVLPVFAKEFAVKTETFVNRICYPSPKAVMDYWRSSTFYNEECASFVKNDVEEYFKSNNEFVIEKHVMAIIAEKIK